MKSDTKTCTCTCSILQIVCVCALEYFDHTSVTAVDFSGCKRKALTEVCVHFISVVVLQWVGIWSKGITSLLLTPIHNKLYLHNLTDIC